MAVIEGGASAALVDVGSNTKAGRIETRPTDVGSLGSYAMAVQSGNMSAGLAGGSTIFSCRWGDATRTMILRRLGFAARNHTTAFTAGNTLFDLIVARSFTASDSAGTSVLPTGNSQKKRTSFGTTLITDLRISSTAALTVGTRTLDSQPLNLVRGMVPATSVGYPMIAKNSIVIPGASTVAFCMDWFDLFNTDVVMEWPLVLVQNEGFIIRGTVPATGVWDFYVLMEWSEVISTAGYN